MKRTVIVVLALAMMTCIGIGSASAANSLNARTIGLNFDVNNDFMLTGKFFILNDLAVLAGFGVGAKGGDAKGTDVAVLAGARKYLRTDDFAPFAGGEIEYRTTQNSCQKDLAVAAKAGAEYFLGKQLSIEGSIGFGYMSTETKAPLAKFKDTTIGTQKAGLSANFYF